MNIYLGIIFLWIMEFRLSILKMLFTYRICEWQKKSKKSPYLYQRVFFYFLHQKYGVSFASFYIWQKWNKKLNPNYTSFIVYIRRWNLHKLSYTIQHYDTSKWCTIQLTYVLHFSSIFCTMRIYNMRWRLHITLE